MEKFEVIQFDIGYGQNNSSIKNKNKN